MADLDALQETKEYFFDIPQKSESFFLKGSNSLDWGMQNRLSRIFNPKTGRTVMLAFDQSSQTGRHVNIESSVDRPAPLPIGLNEWEVED